MHTVLSDLEGSIWFALYTPNLIYFLVAYLQFYYWTSIFCTTHAPIYFLDRNNLHCYRNRETTRVLKPPPDHIYKYYPESQSSFFIKAIKSPQSPFQTEMEYSAFHPSSWNSLFTSALLHPYHFIPENHVHWTETPESHIYSADLPGTKKKRKKIP